MHPRSGVPSAIPPVGVRAVGPFICVFDRDIEGYSAQKPKNRRSEFLSFESSGLHIRFNIAILWNQEVQCLFLDTRH